MAASQSSSARNVRDIRLPAAAIGTAKAAKHKSTKGKGKESAGEATSSTTRKTSGDQSRDVQEDTDDAWSWVTLADSSTSNRPAVFTKDGRYFFAIIGCSVRIYSVATGKVVSTLSPSLSGSSGSRLSDGDGHTDLITAAVLNPHNPFQLLTASLDGLIKVWDFLDAVLLQTIDVGLPVLNMCAHAQIKGHVFVAAKTHVTIEPTKNAKNARPNCLILRVSLSVDARAGNGVQKSSQMVRVGKTKACTSLAVSPSGQWLVSIAGNKAYVASTSSLDAGLNAFSSPENLTCLAFHPNEDYFATGDEKGQIRLWYCLNDLGSSKPTSSNKRAYTTTMHWHAHAVSSLAFSPNGAYLLSGGEESVLVIWQLHTGKKEFVPRVGAPILSVAVRDGADREQEYLLGLADSSMIFINAGALSISRTISRIRLDPAISYQRPHMSAPVPLAVHHLSSTLVLPSSHPSTLQTYSPTSSTLVSELEVASSNRVSRRDEKPIQPSRVERVVICASGEWMATIDKRSGDDDFTTEVHLKIWHWDSTWLLNTRIDRPHGSSDVNAVAFSPTRVAQHGWLLVTTGQDGQLKTWGARTVRAGNGNSEEFWTTRSSFAHRSQTPMYVSWSTDSSLLAVAYGPHAVLLNPASNALVDTLSSAENKDLRAVGFLGRSSRYLITSHDNGAVLWDLVTRSVCWQYRGFNIHHIVPHHLEDLVALVLHPLVEENQPRVARVLVFDPSSSVPRETKTLPFGIRAFAYFPSPSSRFSLAAITNTWNVVLFGDNVRLPAEEGAGARGITAAEVVPRRTLFQDIFGKSAFASAPSAPLLLPATLGGRQGKQKDALAVFDTPTYLAPPIDSLFASLMENFLTPRPEEDPKEQVDDVNQQDALMEAEPTPSICATRVVDDREFGNLVQLFQKHTIGTPATDVSKSPSRRNGEANGVHNLTPNGNYHPIAPSLGSANGKKPHLQKSNIALVSFAAPPEPPSSPVAFGKKRKKSTG